MEDFESIAQGLTIKAPPKAQGRQHVSLSDAEMQLVAQLVNSASYSTILRLMEGQIEKLETEHMRNWKDPEAFTRTGLIAVAARVFFEGFQKEVNFQASEFEGRQQFEAVEAETKNWSPEELLRKSFGL